MTINPLETLSGEGVAVWLDDLSRERLTNGNLSDLVENYHVVGVTTNPTIFEKAITSSDLYDQDLAEHARAGSDVDGAVRDLTTDDVRNAAQLLAPVFERTNGQDGRVSIEVDPRLAYDTEATITQARELWDKVGQKNIFIKIPATPAGLPAITATIAAGISVNVTLIFSVDRYREVMDAYQAGLEQRLAAGQKLDDIASVASFFVSRVDTEVDKRLAAIGTDEALALRGETAVANARTAYGAYQEVIATERWNRLEAAGANRQRPLWASTSTKNPDYPDTLYVTELVAPETVNTMSEDTLEAVADHGDITGNTITSNINDALRKLSAVQAAGVDLDDVSKVLENEGVEKFATSWTSLLKAVSAKLETAE